MRSWLKLLGALCAAFAISANAQNVIPNTSRSTGAAEAPAIVPKVASLGVISADSKLGPKDVVSVQIMEDHEAP